jgi:glutamate dehydrogenase
VKRHFRELGVDVQTTDFTVVGIGDMSGDVFGNGMLLSKHIRLLAAFDHRHVFIDPAPDAATSFAERQRVFDLQRSSWADYAQEKISAGGGVWPRSAKSIPISPQARAALSFDAEQLTPTELIHAILKAPVDLLYNGGIGTYIKASSETHAEVGDRANDALRVDGRELRCKVVAEGGNLGATQRGRIEFALAGGRINTDAIDNSAGVDTSDHEVNIKILLGLPIADGALTSRQRNDVLASMTDDVARLVLRDNYEQTQILSLGNRIAPLLIEDHARFIRFLEREGVLNRGLESLPSDEEIAERAAANRGLTTPERAVLLAYAKIWLSSEIEASALPDDPWVARALVEYFPEKLNASYASYMPRHPLRRDIIATVIVNQTVNRVGASFLFRQRESAGAATADVVRAHLITREAFALRPLWAAIENLDNQVADEVQAGMHNDVGRLMLSGTGWFLRSRRLHDDIAATLARVSPGIAAIAGRIWDLLQGPARDAVRERAAALVAQRVPEPLARRVATAVSLAGALDIVEISAAQHLPVEAVAAIYYDLGARLALDWIAHRIDTLPSEGHWQTLARHALRDDLGDLQRVLAREAAMLPGDPGNPAARIAAWETANAPALERAARVVDEVRAAASPDLAMLSVALRELRNLAGAATSVAEATPAPA